MNDHFEGSEVAMSENEYEGQYDYDSRPIGNQFRGRGYLRHREFPAPFRGRGSFVPRPYFSNFRGRFNYTPGRYYPERRSPIPVRRRSNSRQYRRRSRSCSREQRQSYERAERTLKSRSRSRSQGARRRTRAASRSPSRTKQVKQNKKESNKHKKEKKKTKTKVKDGGKEQPQESILSESHPCDDLKLNSSRRKDPRLNLQTDSKLVDAAGDINSSVTSPNREIKQKAKEILNAIASTKIEPDQSQQYSPSAINDGIRSPSTSRRNSRSDGIRLRKQTSDAGIEEAPNNGLDEVFYIPLKFIPHEATEKLTDPRNLSAYRKNYILDLKFLRYKRKMKPVRLESPASPVEPKPKFNLFVSGEFRSFCIQCGVKFHDSHYRIDFPNVKVSCLTCRITHKFDNVIKAPGASTTSDVCL